MKVRIIVKIYIETLVCIKGMRDNIECKSLLGRLDFVLLRIQQELQMEFIQSATIRSWFR
ncbi:TPA: hypothetical protein ACLBZV_001511 [Bacillus cereus]|uniref:hypothetical protein n=1 Tax=Bacillus cereus TaxID=1396 RepID=UPI001F216103|nr:hypothetical protein [Bacillus cereus]BCC13662.1 hypothetical protein BCM0074_4045 [Bacillus cereus]HDR6305412.1 hypothetical protein [Bacillus cereus]